MQLPGLLLLERVLVLTNSSLLVSCLTFTFPFFRASVQLTCDPSERLTVCCDREKAKECETEFCTKSPIPIVSETLPCRRASVIPCHSRRGKASSCLQATFTPAKPFLCLTSNWAFNRSSIGSLASPPCIARSLILESGVWVSTGVGNVGQLSRCTGRGLKVIHSQQARYP